MTVSTCDECNIKNSDLIQKNSYGTIKSCYKLLKKLLSCVNCTFCSSNFFLVNHWYLEIQKADNIIVSSMTILSFFDLLLKYHLFRYFEVTI